MVFGIRFATRLNPRAIVDALAGLRLAPNAYRRGRAVGFRMCGPKSRIRAELHKQKILRNR